MFWERERNAEHEGKKKERKTWHGWITFCSAPFDYIERTSILKMRMKAGH